MSRAFAAAALAAGALLAGCSAPTDVTDSAGEQAPGTGSPPVAAAGSAEIPADLRQGLPPCPVGDASAPVPGGLPQTELACLGPGDPVALSSLRGTPMIVNAWASWCQPCREELPALASFSQSAGAEVAVLGLDVADDPAAAAALWGELQLPFPSVTDPDSETRADLRWVGLPVSYFVDADGVIVHRHSGAVTDPQQWADLASEHLGAG